ncbi:MAG: hypothetical protein QXF85_02685, partial [Candidatus Micrarchaeaceae archaeon]
TFNSSLINARGGSNSRRGSQYEWSCISNTSNTATKSTTAYTLSVSYGVTYPPYGWPISANVTIGNNAITFCSSSTCTYNPSNLPATYTGGYKPIGPALHAYFGFTTLGYGWPTLGFSVNYNDTVNLLLKKTSQSTISGSVNYPIYSELIVATRLNVENYTKLFAGNPPYKCYVSSNSYAGACDVLSNIDNMEPPVYTVSDPFRYVENTGATQTITFLGLLNSFSLSQGVGAGFYKAGPPSLRIQSTIVPYGETDLISTTSSNNDNLEILINGNVVAEGTGSATYEICGTSTQCLNAGRYTVAAEDTTSNQQTSGNITVNKAPLLSVGFQTILLQSTSNGTTCVPSSDLATATNPSGGSVSISLTYSGSTLLSASGTGTASIDISSICNSLPTGTLTLTAFENGNSQDSVSENIYVSTQTATKAQSGTVLGTSVSGKILVPYSYTYTLTQNWGNAQLVNVTTTNTLTNAQTTTQSSVCSPPAFTPTLQLVSGGSPPTSSSKSTKETIYSYALINVNSNILQTIVENAGTYLQNVYSKGLYVPNLEDTIMPPQVFYNIENNRLFGYLYMNITEPNPGVAGTNINGIPQKDYSLNKQHMINYTSQLNYTITSYTQEYGPYLEYNAPAYDTIETISTSAHGTGSPINYAPVPAITEVPLFDFYQDVSYLSRFMLNLSTQYLGFNMFTLVFQDRFNNTIYAPMPLDIANTVVISLNATPNVESGNTNQTIVQVRGSAYTPSTVLGGAPVPIAGQDIYLYYDRDINFIGYNAVIDPVNAILCSYGSNTISYNAVASTTQSNPNCVLSNPDWYGLTNNANTITYAPSFNSLGVCNPPPNSLLVQNYEQCNIYSAACPATGYGATQYCVPIYSNGTGICTSQLGLFAIAKTDANGQFSANVVACGGGSSLGNGEIMAEYYGSPMQPLSATLLPLAAEANDINLAAPYATPLTTNELNYYYAPNVTYVGVTIGEYLLSIGNISAIAVAAVAVLATALLILKSHRRRNK